MTRNAAFWSTANDTVPTSNQRHINRHGNDDPDPMLRWCEARRGAGAAANGAMREQRAGAPIKPAAEQVRATVSDHALDLHLLDMRAVPGSIPVLRPVSVTICVPSSTEGMQVVTLHQDAWCVDAERVCSASQITKRIKQAFAALELRWSDVSEHIAEIVSSSVGSHPHMAEIVARIVPGASAPEALLNRIKAEFVMGTDEADVSDRVHAEASTAERLASRKIALNRVLSVWYYNPSNPRLERHCGTSDDAYLSVSCRQVLVSHDIGEIVLGMARHMPRAHDMPESGELPRVMQVSARTLVVTRTHILLMADTRYFLQGDKGHSGTKEVDYCHDKFVLNTPGGQLDADEFSDRSTLRRYERASDVAAREWHEETMWSRLHSHDIVVDESVETYVIMNKRLVMWRVWRVGAETEQQLAALCGPRELFTERTQPHENAGMQWFAITDILDALRFRTRPHYRSWEFGVAEQLAWFLRPLIRM